MARKQQDQAAVIRLENEILFEGSSSKLLFDNRGQPRPALLHLLNKIGFQLKNGQDPLTQIHDWTQKNLLRKGERWDPQDQKYEALKEDLMPFFDELEMVKEIRPSFKTYDGAIINGALLKRVRLRLSYLIDLWKQGVRFNVLVFLGGERPLQPELESEKELYAPENSPLAIRKDWNPPANKPLTEAEMERLVWDQSEIPHEMRSQVKTIFVNAPNQQLPNSTEFRRPTTDDTFSYWLKNEKPSGGKYLLISNGQFIHRQDLVARNILPRNIGVDSAGAKTDPNLTVALYLDELARWIDQFKRALVKTEQEKN